MVVLYAVLLQVALRWLLQKQNVTSAIIGCKTIAQLEDNMGASDGWELSTEEMEILDSSSAHDVPYPYSMINRCNKRFDPLF